MDSVTFSPARLHGTASVPPSKSEAHRALLLAALGLGDCLLTGFTGELCLDTQAMIRGVTALGAQVIREGDALRVRPRAVQPVDQADVGACAAALRMLIPCFAAIGQSCTFSMEQQLLKRPLTAYMTMSPKPFSVERSGVQARVSGSLGSGEYRIGGSQSSQFASGLLIALSSFEGASSRVSVVPPIQSRPYLDLTMHMIGRFSGECREIGGGVFSVVRDSLKNPETLSIAGDFTQAAVLLCAGALSGGVLVGGLTQESWLQGDCVIVSILKDMGLAAQSLSGGEIIVSSPSRARLAPVQLDLSNTPDIAPLVALMCTQARGVSTLTGLGALRHKECDRLLATKELLSALGAHIACTDDDVLTITGGEPLAGGVTLDSKNDHRMAMLLSVAALVCQKPVTVTGAASLCKSWPDYLKVYSSLGGKAE